VLGSAIWVGDRVFIFEGTPSIGVVPFPTVGSSTRGGVAPSSGCNNPPAQTDWFLDVRLSSKHLEALIAIPLRIY
jgi:hypothetical protein